MKNIIINRKKNVYINNRCMAIIKYDNSVINKPNINSYIISLNNNINELIFINNNDVISQIQFKLTIKGFKQFSFMNINYKNTYDIIDNMVYFISFILEKNQEIKLNFFNSSLDIDKIITIENLSENIININDKINIDKIYIINLDRRKDRKKKIIDELKKIGVKNYEFITAVDGNDVNIQNLYKKLKIDSKTKLKSAGHLGCLLSHKKALEKAFINKYNQILILEDDIFFKSKNFINDLKKIIICPWKIIFLGAPILEKKIFLNKWAHCDKFPGTYGYIIKRELIQNILILLKNMENSIDIIFMKYLQKYNFCFILNDFVLTDIVDSDTSKKKILFQKLIDNLNRDE